MNQSESTFLRFMIGSPIPVSDFLSHDWYFSFLLPFSIVPHHSDHHHQWPTSKHRIWIHVVQTLVTAFLQLRSLRRPASRLEVKRGGAPSSCTHRPSHHDHRHYNNTLPAPPPANVCFFAMMELLIFQEAFLPIVLFLYIFHIFLGFPRLLSCQKHCVCFHETAKNRAFLYT